MKIVELRHLDGIKGNFGISDGVEYRASPTSKQEGAPSEYIISTMKPFVEQQQYIFETLWNKAIPAKQRIKEIEEGAKREFVETIRDPSEIQKISFDLIKKAEEEILVFFSTAKAFYLQEKAGALELLKEAAAIRGVKIRVLVPMDKKIRNEMSKQLQDLGIGIRDSKKSLLAKVTTLVIDNALSLTVDLKDDSKKTSEEDAIGLATYSNNDSTVLTYVSIFENLWIQTRPHKKQEESAAS
jgi:two-component system, OmpR family, sensor histidine kinase VicK